MEHFDFYAILISNSIDWSRAGNGLDLGLTHVILGPTQKIAGMNFSWCGGFWILCPSMPESDGGYGSPKSNSIKAEL